MNADDVVAAYADALTDTVTVTRPGTPSVSADARARIKAFVPNFPGGDVMQGDQQIIILKADLDLAGFPVPIRNRDKITCGGVTMIAQSVDANTRKVGDTLIAYVVRARGQ